LSIPDNPPHPAVALRFQANDKSGNKGWIDESRQASDYGDRYLKIS